MAADNRHAPVALPEPSRPLGPSQIIALVVVAIAALIVAASVDHGVPIVAAAAVGALAPRGQKLGVRVGIAIIAAVLTLFTVRFWPGEITAASAPNEAGSHLLSWIIGLPIVGGLAILFVPRQSLTVLKGGTVAIMLATLAACIPLLKTPMGAGYHFNQDVAWLEEFGIHFHVAVDGVSLWLVVLTAFIVPIAAFASFGSVQTRIKDWCFALLLLEGGMIGSFLSLDLFLFYVFWELMLIPMYVMIGVWGGQNRIKAAIKFFLYTMFGSVLMLAAILYLAYTYKTLSPDHRISFDYFELQRVVTPRHVQIWLWLAFTVSFFIKVPMVPLHTWLPDAHTEAPTAGSVILAAVMLKLGTYGYLRFSMGLFPQASAEHGPLLAGIAVLGGIIYGALCAWKQDDVKRLVAYSSVAHLGYVMLGLFACTAASLEGSVLQMVNHGISTGALFLLVGVIYDRRHTRMVDEFGGLAKTMPIYAAFFIIATLASIGLPATNGFVGEFMIITGTFAANGGVPNGTLGHFNGVQAVGAAIGVILGALYMLSVVQKMFFGPITKKANKFLPDLNGRELVALVPLVAMIFIIGLFPRIFLDQISGATGRIEMEYKGSWARYDHRVQTLSPEDDWSPADGHDHGFKMRLEPRHPSAPPLPGASVAAAPAHDEERTGD